ncbi:MAG: PKD domain-containing protein [Planctomycetes bacterium]|nr:PKD domain-containing protein [Planctomycetota bacterium]
MYRRSLLLLSVVLVSGPLFAASLGGPALDTGEQYYPGLGKFRTIDDCIAAAYAADGNPATDRGKVEAIWKWLSRFTCHGPNRPIETVNNGSMTSSDSIGCFDTMKFLTSYTYAICFASSSLTVGMWEAAGYEARGRAVGGHTVPEVYYSGDYHYYDVDMGGTCFQADHATIASVDEVAANDGLFAWDYRTGGYDWPYFPWDGIGTMQGAFSNPTPWKYNDFGMSVHPTSVNLRRGETFTRYFNYDRTPWGAANAHWAGLNVSGFDYGPVRNVTFTFDPPVDGTNNGVARLPWVTDGNVRYGNGVFEWVPDLSTDAITDGAESITSVTWGSTSPKLHGDGGAGEVIIDQWTPFVIAGNPASYDFLNNPTDAVVISGTAVGSGVQVGVSNNGGLSYDMRSVTGAFSQDFSVGCVGKYGYKVRIYVPSAAVGLDDLTLRTVTMCAAPMMPHLADGGNTVTYTANREGILYKAPDTTNATNWADSFESTSNLTFAGGQSAYHCSVANTSTVATMVIRFDSPNGGDITKVAAAVGMQLPQPPSATSNMSFEYSRNGSTWTNFYSRNISTDAQHWMHFFDETVTVPGTGSTAYIRVSYTPGSSWANFTQLSFYAYYDTGTLPEIQITHCWDDSVGADQTHVENIAAGTSSTTYSVSCGTNVLNQYVSFHVPGAPVDPELPTANFTFSPTSPTLADTVTFTDTSTTPVGTITNWSWDFGGDGTSTAQSPTHMFSTTGTFAVTLIVTNSVGKTDSIVKNVTVTSGVSTTDTFQQGTSGYSGCDDTYLREEHYSVPYGASDEIRIYGDNAGDWSARIAIRFDLSSIPAGSTVTDVELQLYGWNIYEAGTTNMYETTADWDEAVAAWRDRTAAADWAADGGDFSATLLSSLTTAGNEDNSWLVWGSTANFVSVVQGWIDSPSTNHGVMLVSGATAVENRFRSSEWATVTERPKLIVTYDGGAGPDSQPPAVNVTAAALEGTVDDDSTVPTEVILNGSVSIPVTAGDWQSGNVALSAGTNNLTLEASDASSNTRQVNLDIVVP